MEQFAELIRGASDAVLVWGTDFSVRPSWEESVSMILNLGLARGYVGRARAGLMPMGAHQGALGATRLGACPFLFPGLKPVNRANAKLLQDHYGFPVPPTPGWSVEEMMQAGHRGDVDVLYCLGGDFLGAFADRAEAFRAISNVPCRVYQDRVLRQEMLIEPKGDVLLLPSKTPSEQDGGGTFFTSERRVLFGPEIPRPNAPVGEARADWRILCDLAAVVYPDRALAWQSESGPAIRQEMAWVVPHYAGMQYLDKCGDTLQCGGPHLCAGGRFPTPDGKAHFQVVPLPPVEASSDLASSRTSAAPASSPVPAKAESVGAEPAVAALACAEPVRQENSSPDKR
jgi:predicted molibdopterin-dependent oxidoreductase YjgC